MSTEIITREQTAVANTGEMTLKGVIDRVNLIHQVMEKVMVKGTHYGTIPGCGNRDVLFKPGADVLAMAFRLSPEYRIDRHELTDGHREYEVACIMRGTDGTVIGEGVGSATTMEGKYRFRRDGSENPNIADVYNTVLKMAKKRAHVDATLTCTGASDMFTQDLIDEDEPAKTPVKQPKVKPPSKPTADKQSVTGVIESVEVKSGDKNGKEWTRYGIHIAGMVIGTFDTTIGQDAETVKGDGQVTIEYTDDGKYKTAVALTLAGTDEELPL